MFSIKATFNIFFYMCIYFFNWQSICYIIYILYLVQNLKTQSQNAHLIKARKAINLRRFLSGRKQNKTIPYYMRWLRQHKKNEDNDGKVQIIDKVTLLQNKMSPVLLEEEEKMQTFSFSLYIRKLAEHTILYETGGFGKLYVLCLLALNYHCSLATGLRIAKTL